VRINIVVAIASNGVIGRDKGLPWRLSADLKHFKSITMGHPIVMGRRTHESIGRALPGRMNIVVSRQREYCAAGCVVADSLDAATIAAGAAAELMVVGGARLYAESLPYASRIYLTEVHAAPAGDTLFPAFDERRWIERARQRYAADETNEFDYSFVVLDRISEPNDTGFSRDD
jgi:dihydrofolate reductase